MRRAALLLVALAACGKRPPAMTARCALGPDGEEVPKQLLAQPWLLHDLDVADHLSRTWHCVVQGRTNAKVWSDAPPVHAMTHRTTGDARIAIDLDDLAPDQEALVLRWDGGSASIPVPARPRVSVAVKVDGGGVAHLSGTVTGADAVTIAGEPVAVTGGAFTRDVPLAAWVFAHATVADLPIDPLPARLTMLVEAGGPGGAHALATMPTPREAMLTWLQAVLAPGAAVPYAPPADFDAPSRPTAVVLWDWDRATGSSTPRLRALVRDTTIGAVEAIAHVTSGEHATACGSRARRLVVLYAANDGAELAREDFEGPAPEPCARDAVGPPPDELAITAWVAEHTNPLTRPTASPRGAR